MYSSIIINLMKSIQPNRTGKTVKQIPGNYLAFIPNKVSPNGPPSLKYDVEMWKLLSEADLALGELNGVTKPLYNPNLFIGFYVQKEALLSAQIEGTQCSLDEILQVDKVSGGVKPVEEVINYIQAMNQGLEKLESLPFSSRLIKEIHKVMMQGVRGKEKSPGEFKHSQNWIGPPGGTLNEAVFVPPPPHTIPDLMGDLENCYHTESELPMLLKAAILHAHFETIHPFTDGNGRLGRLLITFFLCHKKILDKPLLYLSLFFKENKSEYYNLLMRTRTNGEWEEWFKFFLRGVRSTSQEAAKTARELIFLREEQRSLIIGSLSQYTYAHQIYDIVTESPIISIAKISKKHEIPFPTVQRTADRLKKIGVVDITEDKYGKVILFTKCLEILRRGTH